jgi:hypothetical protein
MVPEILSGHMVAMVDIKVNCTIGVTHMAQEILSDLAVANSEDKAPMVFMATADFDLVMTTEVVDTTLTMAVDSSA